MCISYMCSSAMYYLDIKYLNEINAKLCIATVWPENFKSSDFKDFGGFTRL